MIVFKEKDIVARGYTKTIVSKEKGYSGAKACGKFNQLDYSSAKACGKFNQLDYSIVAQKLVENSISLSHDNPRFNVIFFEGIRRFSKENSINQFEAR